MSPGSHFGSCLMLKLVLQSEYRIIVRHRLSRAVGPNLRAGGGLTLGDLVLFYVRESAPQSRVGGNLRKRLDTYYTQCVPLRCDAESARVCAVCNAL